VELFGIFEISVIDCERERERGWEGKKKENRRDCMVTRRDVWEGCDVPFAMVGFLE
jgi:hypothetical protein